MGNLSISNYDYITKENIMGSALSKMGSGISSGVQTMGKNLKGRGMGGDVPEEGNWSTKLSPYLTNAGRIINDEPPEQMRPMMPLLKRKRQMMRPFSRDEELETDQG